MRTKTPRQAGPRGLIVEENPNARESLRLLLSLHGYEVRAAADGPEGLRLALDWQRAARPARGNIPPTRLANDREERCVSP